MGFVFFPRSIVHYVLLLFMFQCPQGSSASRNIAMEQQVALDDHQRIRAEHEDDKGMHPNHINIILHNLQQHDNLSPHLQVHPSPLMDHMDPSLNVFFTLNDLKLGKVMPIYFSNKNFSTSPRLLTSEESNSIPFSLSQLPYLLQFFSFSKDSPQAKAMEYTLKQCAQEPIKGETKFCATSLESMLDFTQDVFGLDTQLKALTTTLLIKPTVLLQNYTILDVPKEIFAPKMIACHTMPYPYSVFYCHGQETENRLFEISLGGDNGERVVAAAVCHMDTSQWDRDHVSFRILNIEPGTSPVCHFFPTDNLVWVPLLDHV
ncbi:BURP domain-containing protein [Cephalotus follicularis]|uniref:BURP domain-containing protein n=1 Tax=Cephalotus follicularis TaxID=3775 RepID=A0A1Q3C0F5_CEPFO|nr:BURP domain-containing protein [Cephalotus follicularis]